MKENESSTASASAVQVEQPKAAVTASARKISTNVLALLQSARQTYGLRTSDYARYHAHAVRRIATLSRATSTSMQGAATAAKKTASKSTGSNNNAGGAAKAKRLAAIDGAALARDERLVELMLWEAERAWAEGMRTREELATLNNKSDCADAGLAKKRHRSQRRLCRASQHAKRLAEMLQQSLQDGSVTASTTLQAEIYSNILAGTYAFSQASSNSGRGSTSSSSSVSGATPAATGTKLLSTAYVLLESFAKHSNRANDEALAFELLDELEPMVRFCAYKAELSSGSSVTDTARSMGESQLKQDSKLSKLVSQHEQEEAAASSSKKGKNQQSATVVKQIQWRGVDIPVKSAELASALGKVQSALSQLDKSSQKGSRKASKKVGDVTSSSLAASSSVGEKTMARYDRALSTLSEAEDRARKLVEDNATALSKAHSARFESATKPLGAAHSYIVFQLLSLRISRDEALLASSLAKLQYREEKVADKKKGRGMTGVSATVKRRRAKTFPILVKLLDTMLQSLEQIRELDIVEEDSADLASHVDAKIAFEKARRCLYLAQIYALVDKYPESLSLSQRANLYIRQLRSSPLTSDELASLGSAGNDDEAAPSNLGVSAFAMPQDSVKQLEAQLAKAEDRNKKDWFLFQQASEQEAKANQDDIATEAINGLLINGAPAKKAKKKKAGPLFFDVAFNYVAGVDLEVLDAAWKGQLEDLPAAASSIQKEAEQQQPGLVQQTKDVVMETAAQAKEAVEEAVSGSAPNTPSKAASGGGIWGFFGRGKK